MNINSELLKEIQSRKSQNPHNYGIISADRYVKTIQDCIGSDLCYRFASKGNISFNDLMEKATKTLTYNNPDMVWEEKLTGSYTPDQQVDLPKNTLMMFRHVLTTSRKDRDGDVLRTKGARPDPNMLLLWQHIHTLPIGKTLQVAEHTSNKLSLISAIVDVNDMAHDAAVMIDNKMGRFSHGFKALEFSKLKEEQGQTTGGSGFDVKEFEIMEASLVSVPANIDAETEDIILTLVGNDKLTSGVMKGVGESISTGRPTKVVVAIELKEETAEEEEIVDGTNTKGKRGCCAACDKGEPCTGGTPKEADDGAKDENEDDAKYKEVKEDREDKGGRVFSAQNKKNLQEVKKEITDLRQKEFAMSYRGRKRCQHCEGLLSGMIKMMDKYDGDRTVEIEEKEEVELSAKELMSKFITVGTELERSQMTKTLAAIKAVEEQTSKTEKYQEFVRSHSFGE